MKHTKKITILHSNDLHGDFLAEQVDEKLVGGVSMLSGYIEKVRAEQPNTIYAIAGDMFRGSVIDSEYKGLSTIEIMNALAPDVVTIGNHEVDYGIAHLLFIEKCALFTVGLQNYHFKNIESFFNISYDTLCKIQKPRSVATSCQDILMEYFREHEMLDAAVDGRMTILPSMAREGD